ncbi:hypothetical protein OE903_15000 [Bacillus sp. B6(2022)]|nr:hypothetical protein [Bacillus sp. B6(2022)]
MDSYIIGNREGLIELKSAIDQALKSNVGQAELFPSDLEDYTTYVALVDDKKSWILLLCLTLMRIMMMKT